MVAISEIVSLIILALSFLLMLAVLKKVPKWKYVMWAFVFVLITGVATIAEDFFAKDLLNWIEHISWLIGALMFTWVAKKFTIENVV